MTELQLKFADAFGGKDCGFLFDEPLKDHCTFRIGGNAEILFIPKNTDILRDCLAFIRDNHCAFHVLGNGSNVLISDSGLKGVTVKLMGGLTGTEYLGDGVIRCEAGVSLKKLCLFALEKSLTGLEFAYGIPGSVGGAVYMNAGAYRGEIKNVLASVVSIDPATLQTEETPLEDLLYEYRNTSFMKNGKIVVAAYFKLAPGDEKAIRDKMDELMQRRKNSQPLEFPSAGSTFKRPFIGYAAAHIEQCGLKGTRVGGAEVSRKHSGFVINTGGATYDDVVKLMDAVTQTVFYKTGVLLHPEVEFLKD